MSTSTKNNANAKSVWPLIELPAKPAVHYNQDNTLHSVESLLNYCSPHVTHMQTRRDLGGSDSELEGASWQPCQLPIHNHRLKLAKEASDCTVDRQGFQLVPSSMKEHTHIDFRNKDSVIDEYYPVCEQLVKDTTGAPMVYAFDHNVRVSGAPSSDQKDNTNTVLQHPIGVVHNDYTHVSAPRRLEQLAQPPKANDSLQSKLQGKPLLDPQIVQEVLEGKRRFVFLNVWRNIQRDAPVQQFPLACVTATTQSLEDFLTFSILYQDRVGENYFARYNPRHEWNYVPHMVHDEALLLKQWDSQGTLALRKEADDKDFVSTFSLHSAFQDPTSPKDAPPRESIEVRCVLIWDKEE